MGFFSELKKITNPVKGFKETIKPIVNLPSKKNKYSLYGMYGRKEDAKQEARAEAAANDQAQLDLLNAQQNQAKNALADLSLDNAPNVIAGGTADVLLGIKKRKQGAKTSSSISSSLGLT